MTRFVPSAVKFSKPLPVNPANSLTLAFSSSVDSAKLVVLFEIASALVRAFLASFSTISTSTFISNNRQSESVCNFDFQSKMLYHRIFQIWARFH